jgi:hypothetical protein
MQVISSLIGKRTIGQHYSAMIDTSQIAQNAHANIWPVPGIPTLGFAGHLQLFSGHLLP